MKGFGAAWLRCFDMPVRGVRVRLIAKKQSVTHVLMSSQFGVSDIGPGSWAFVGGGQQ